MKTIQHKMRNVVSRLFSKPEKEDDEGPSATPYIHQRDNLAQADLDLFREHLKTLFQNRDALAAGQMRVLGLAKIKDKLGTTWPKFSDKVKLIVRDTISKKTDVDDFVFELDELNFLILFGSKSAKEAERLCIAIAAHIWRNLFGEENGFQELKVNAIIVEADGQICIDEVDPLQAISQQIEERGEPAVLESDDQTLRHFDQDSETPLSDDSLSDDVVSKSTINWTQVETEIVQNKIVYQSIESQETHVSTLAREVSGLKKAQIAYLYRPIWSVKDDAIISYFITPVINGDRRIDYRTSPLMTPEMKLKIDLEVLANAINLLKTNKAEGVNIPIASTLCASSLRQPRVLETLACELNRIPDDLRKYLNFEISELDPHQCWQVMELLEKFDNHFGQMYATLKGLSDFTPYVQAGIKCLGMPRSTVGLEEAEFVHILSVFADKCHQLDLKTYAHSLRSRKLALTAVKLGFDIVSGDAISPPLQTASKAYRYSINDLFKSEGLEDVPKNEKKTAL